MSVLFKSRFSRKFGLSDDELLTILEKDHTDIPINFDEALVRVGLDHYQRRAFRRMWEMEEILCPNPTAHSFMRMAPDDITGIPEEDSLWRFSDQFEKEMESEGVIREIEKLWKEGRYPGLQIKKFEEEKDKRLERFKKMEARSRQIKRARRKGRPGRLAFSLRDLQFLMNTVIVDGGKEESRALRIEAVGNRVHGGESSYRRTNLTYLNFLERKKRGSDVEYYFPGQKEMFMKRCDDAIRTNMREAVWSKVKSVRKGEIIPSQACYRGAYYLRLNRSEIAKMDPLVKELQEKMSKCLRERGMEEPEEDFHLPYHSKPQPMIIIEPE